MSEQDYEGIDDMLTAIRKAADADFGTPANAGRIFEGQIFVTSKEWALISDEPSSKTWTDMTAVEKLTTIPVRIINNGGAVTLNDGRTLTVFNDVLYLLPVSDFNIPPLPRLHLDGRYVMPRDS